jgi:transcriptional regulator with XRE-family HTH domain
MGMSLIEEIKILCKEYNTSIPGLEKELEFSRGAIYKWDASRPTVDKVQKVAEYFDVTIDSLVRGNGNPLLETSEPFDKDSLLRRIRETGLSVGQVITVLDQARSAVLDETAVTGG